MPTRDEILIWLRRSRRVRVAIQEHWNAGRIEIGFGFALLVSLVFVIVQSGNA
jgi:hypothetical protein